ncbi:MAG: FRG domain-containing protein [Bacteroidaceae bacterium]|nr:FRG domain-containing protein [Bacteroidaceae bacterium]
MESVIKEIQFNNFDSFLKSISYGGELYNIIYPNFIFRGESSDKFKLIPSALREYNKDKIMQLGNCHGTDCQMMRIAAEYAILRKFYYSCDDANLYVPNCCIRKYPIDDVSVFLNHETWLPEDLYEIAGLAQHYGLPTRLLDWSKDIYVSLYFACLGAMKQIKMEAHINDDNIVLWALNAKKIESDKSIGKMIPLKFIKPSYYGNPNLGAQKGLFTLWEFVSDEQRKNEVEVTPLDTFLINKAIDNQTLLYKLTLPTKFVLYLYVMLRNLGYDASRIFPGYNGISQLISEDLLYNQIFSMVTA